MAPTPYEFLEHTADVKFRAYGGTLDEAFANAVLAATHVLVPPSEINPVRAKKISVKANRKDTLLYELLQEVIYLMDVDLFIAGRVVKLKIGKTCPYELTATLEGDSVKNYMISGSIKSATYNEMEVHEDCEENPEKNCWVQVVLDI